MGTDQDIYKHATGQALSTVEQHQRDQDIHFYCGWFCPFAQRTWLVLEHKGIPYKYVEELPYKKTPEFLRISPKGLVPALTYKGEALNESIVLCEFLEELHPEQNPLLPSDLVLRARVRLAIDHISKSIIPAFYKLLQQTDAAQQPSCRTQLEDAFRTFESGIKGPWYAGQEVGMADLMLAPWILRLQLLEEHRGFDVARVGPKFKEWTERVMQLPSVKATSSENQKYTEVYGRYLRNESQSMVAQATRSGQVLP